MLRYGITYPLFIPDLGGSVVKILVAGSGSKLLAEELNRLTLLGSNNAAALLTLLDTQGALVAGQYASAALERCKTAAAAGHAYAQFVMGWVNRKLGKNVEAIRCLNASINGKFLPAFIDASRFVASGVGMKSPDRQAALKILWAAHKLGHRTALALIGRHWLAGAAGWFARLASLLLYPLAVLRAAHYAARHPLSEKAFVLPRTNEPLLRDRR